MKSPGYYALLSRYFNSGVILRTDKIRSLINPKWPFSTNASFIKSEHAANFSQTNSAYTEYQIPSYTGDDPVAMEIKKYLQNYLAQHLHAAIVHGSIATNEKINYSDFDGLVILKNEVFDSEKKIREVAMHLSKCYSLMIKGDPLQHHGWFVSSENDCNNWPSWYFPPAIFNYSRSLLQPVMLRLHTDEKREYVKTNLDKIANGVLRTLSQGFPTNAYQLKSLMSEFMMLPTLFLHIRNGTGVYKKDSFTEAVKLVGPEIWEGMKTVSKLRQEWNYNSGIKLGNTPVLVTPSVKKRQVRKSMKVPADLTEKLDDKLLVEMVMLASYFVSESK